MTSVQPDLSVILITPDNYETVRQTMTSLQQQTAKSRIEILLVAPSRQSLGEDEAVFDGFGAYQILENGPIDSIARARVRALEVARAPIVVMAEDHSFPLPEWADALIEAHQAPYAAVGVEMRNANPGSMTSWTEFVVSFGDWMEHATAQIMDYLPGHNTSYKREVLLSYRERLESLLSMELFLHQTLREDGYQLYLEPRAATRHVNFSRLSHTLPHRYIRGREFAALRAKDWSLLKRMIYACASPLIPLVRTKRHLAQIRRAGQSQQLIPRILPIMLLSLGADALGEAVGYLFGIGKALELGSDAEFHRERHLRAQDT